MDMFLERASQQTPVSAKMGLVSRGRRSGTDRRPLRLAIVNNMPDAALVATERQFTRLATAASDGPLDIALYHLPGVPRGEQAREVLALHYKPVDELYRFGADALIVTGNEPRASRLDAEPYWDQMARLIDWASEARSPSLWSCLAAHAVALRLDGIERRRLPQKKSGVLTSAVQANAGLALQGSLSVCHSRMNELPETALCSSGYQVLTEAPGGHVDIFTKSFRAPFLFLQGHPEYDADSLMREYRRDVGRYLNGARDIYPEVPENYFDDATVLRMENYRTEAERTRDLRMFDAFPAVRLRAGLEQRLAQSARAVFQAWMESVAALRAAA